MVWGGRDLEHHPVPAPSSGHGHLPLDQGGLELGFSHAPGTKCFAEALADGLCSVQAVLTAKMLCGEVYEVNLLTVVLDVLMVNGKMR